MLSKTVLSGGGAFRADTFTHFLRNFFSLSDVKLSVLPVKLEDSCVDDVRRSIVFVLLEFLRERTTVTHLCSERDSR